MSHAHDNDPLMDALLREDPEGWARLKGLIAMLALPALNSITGPKRRRVEVEIMPGIWQQVDRVKLEEKRVLFWHTNGVTNQYPVLREERGIPRWRIEGQVSAVTVEDR